MFNIDDVTADTIKLLSNAKITFSQSEGRAANDDVCCKLPHIKFNVLL